MKGWDTMEQWTYIIGTGLVLLNAIIFTPFKAVKSNQTQDIVQFIKSSKNMTVEDLQKLANQGKFLELLNFLDQCFGENPDYQYSQLKQNLMHTLNGGNDPKPAQLQGLLVFLDSELVKKCLDSSENQSEDNSGKSSNIQNVYIKSNIVQGNNKGEINNDFS